MTDTDMQTKIPGQLREEAKPEPFVPHAISESLDEAYVKADVGEVKCPLRISSFGDCTQKLYQLATGALREQLTGRTLRIFEIGNQRGNALANYLVSVATKHKLQIGTEVPLWCSFGVGGSDNAKAIIAKMRERFMPKDLFDGSDAPEDLSVRFNCGLLSIRGRCDALLYEKDGSVHLIEFKTKNSFGFDKLEQEGPGRQYLMQVMGYVTALRQMGVNVRSATFVFENKDNCELKALPVDISDDGEPQREWNTWSQQFKEMLILLAKSDTSNDAVLPEPMFAATSSAISDGKAKTKLPWNCNYCGIDPHSCASNVSKRVGMQVTLADKRRSGAEKPAWEASIAPAVATEVAGG